MMNESLSYKLRELRLSGMSETLAVRLQEASGNRLSHTEFLELILQDELLIRQERKIARGVKSAGFRELKSLEDFDWQFNPTIKRNMIYDLATGQFIKQRRDVLFCAPPGTGKSHLVQAIGYQMIKLDNTVLYRSIFDVVRDFLHDEGMEGHARVVEKYLKPDLLIIDDFGMKELPRRSGEFLFEIIMRRYEKRSTMMTSNRPLEDWGKLLGDVATASAILDRFMHQAQIITMSGKSYRMSHRGEVAEDSNKASAGQAPTGSKKSEKDSNKAKAPTGLTTEE